VITHVFFGLYGVLADKVARAIQFPDAIAEVLCGRYGGAADTWRRAYAGVLADWDSYYADLNLSGDDGIAALWEGEFRTTRALFRLAGVPELPKDELTTLARALTGTAAARCDLLYPDAKRALRTLHTAGIALGVASHATAAHARGVLTGAGALDAFTGSNGAALIIAPEVVERFERDTIFYAAAARRANVDPAACLVVDHAPDALDGARAAGMQTARRDHAFDWAALTARLQAERHQQVEDRL